MNHHIEREPEPIGWPEYTLLAVAVLAVAVTLVMIFYFFYS